MNQISIDYYMDHFNKQSGQKYPCSNQLVTCAIITTDRNKAISIMEAEGAIMSYPFLRDQINWNLNGEIWMWRQWNKCPLLKGYRFYKLMVDKDISDNLFDEIAVCSELYCCSMKVF